MFAVTKLLVATFAFLGDCLTRLIDDGAAPAAGPLDGCSVKFFTAGPVLNPDMVIGDFTLAALGNAGTALDALGSPINLPGNRRGLSQNVKVTAGAGPTAETILGAVVLDGGGDVIAATLFEYPATIVNEGDFIDWDFVLAIPSALPSGF